jgi:hypothetical protein
MEAKWNPNPTSVSHSFDRVPQVALQRSKFDRSHALKTTFDSGFLVPIFVDEVLPGDTFNLRASFFARMSTPLKPVMDNLYFDTHFFFVPNRLLWTHWEQFNGYQANPGDSISFTLPTVPIAAGGAVVGTLYDYFGVPSGALITGGFNVCNFWGRAYNKIYNDWFRDENQQNSVTVDTGDGPDVLANYVLKRRGKRFDYFTGCLPSPQKGTAVSLPVGSATAPVKGNGALNLTDGTNSLWLGGSGVGVVDEFLAVPAPPQAVGVTITGAHSNTASKTLGVTATGANSGLIADLSSALATTINQLRLAEWTQVLLERDNRGGTRYTEIIRSHFGVVSPDFRLQRSEFLGGGSTRINQHPVPQTGATGATGTSTAQGTLASFATMSASGHGFNKSFTEHGVIVGLCSVRADLTYQQGLRRMWSRSTRYDFYWPSLASIGEQAVLNQEIFLVGGAQDLLAFGYQERYGEYRYMPSLITGKFRSTYATPLDFWHLAQNFSALPVLGDTFISETPPVSRVVAVTTEPQFILDCYYNLVCARPMPVYGIPSLGGHL